MIQYIIIIHEFFLWDKSNHRCWGRNMKKTGVFLLALCLILGMLNPLKPVSATETTEATEATTNISGSTSDPSVTAGSHSADGAVPLLGMDRIVENVDAAIVYERESETLLYAFNPDASMDPASLVKIMTALIAVQRGNMEDAVTVTEQVLATVPFDAVSADLQAGEILTLQDLVYCMMVGSANDAAAVIAAHVLGSQEAFVAEMNRYAQELGCNGTNFANVHGLYSAQQYITVRDAARILAAAMENEQFRTVFGALEYTVPATNFSEARELHTGNFLVSNNEVEIYFDSRATGGRTGVANDGTRCLATAAQVNGLDIVCITMGSKSVYADDGYTVKKFGGYKETSALLDAVDGGYKRVNILFEGQALRQCQVDGGDAAVTIGPKVSVATVLPDTIASTDLSYRYVDNAGGFAAPIEKGSHLSYLQIWYGNLCVAQAELFALNGVAVKTEPQQQQGTVAGDNNAWATVLVVICVVVAVVALAFVLTRLSGKLRRAAANGRSRRYRKNRRRSR